MYILRGLRLEFDQNVRILENQRDTTINDVRYALKQEEARREKRKEDRTTRDQEGVRRAKEKLKGELSCYNCGKRGHMSRDCYGSKKCYNCQGVGHISTDCKETRNYKSSRGRGQRGGFQRKNHQREDGRGCGRGEAKMTTTEEAVRTASDQICANETERNIQEGVGDTNIKKLEWLLDSGSTSHMTCDVEIFDKLQKEEREITLADKEGRKLISRGIGEVPMKQEAIKNGVRLKNVLCVPDLNTNLLSVAKFTDYGYDVKFNKYGAKIYKDQGRVQMTAVRRGNAYYVESMATSHEVVIAAVEEDIWHRRLGHVNKRTIEDMKKEELVDGMKEHDRINVQCECCIEGKACRKVHARLGYRRTNGILQLWHMDLIGPINPISKGGKRYVFTIIDDYSRMFFIEVLKEKGEAADVLKKLIILKENQSGKRVKAIRSDNGGEFIGADLKKWLENKGIKHELSPARTPQCNGVAERGNRSLIEMTRSIMSDSGLPMDFWTEAVCTSAHIKNRVKTNVHGKTPYELWNGRKPNVKYMRRFGCVAYLLNKGGLKNKFEPKTIKGIF